MMPVPAPSGECELEVLVNKDFQVTAVNDMKRH
jgi:hypothetical protein